MPQQDNSIAGFSISVGEKALLVARLYGTKYAFTFFKECRKDYFLLTGVNISGIPTTAFLAAGVDQDIDWRVVWLANYFIGCCRRCRMFTILENYVLGVIHSLMLDSYGWQRRKRMYQGRLTVQWQDPYSLHWYSEKTALRLMRVQALDQFHNDSR